MRIWQLGAGDSRSDWERVLAGAGWRAGEVVKADDRGREVWKVELFGELVAVKVRAVPGVLDRLRFRLGGTDLTRAHLGAALLTARGFESPGVRVLALVRDGGAWFEVLVANWAKGAPMIRRWCDAGEAERNELAQLAGALIGALSAKGVFNRDAKPSNVVVDGEVLSLIDVGGVRLAGEDRALELARMLSAQGFEPAGVGERPALGQMLACVRSACAAAGITGLDRRVVVGRLRQLIDGHGDPAPKDSPVAQADEMR